MSDPDASSKLIESGKVQQAADNCLKHTQIAEDLPDFIIIDLKEALYKHQKWDRHYHQKHKSSKSR